MDLHGGLSRLKLSRDLRSWDSFTVDGRKGLDTYVAHLDAIFYLISGRLLKFRYFVHVY